MGGDATEDESYEASAVAGDDLASDGSRWASVGLDGSLGGVALAEVGVVGGDLTFELSLGAGEAVALV